ncbi:MAG: hypothetical protein ACRC62_33585 [Microcoleus sp.]
MPSLVAISAAPPAASGDRCANTSLNRQATNTLVTALRTVGMQQQANARITLFVKAWRSFGKFYVTEMPPIFL